jgi:large subunit ribosomal protein L5
MVLMSGMQSNVTNIAKPASEGSESTMKSVRISKVVINMGTGSDDQRQSNAILLLERLTGAKPASAISRHRLPEFKIAKGQNIGAFATLRGPGAAEVLKRLLAAVDNKLSRRQVVDNAINFGIKEYIDINGLKYDPKIGMMGMNVNVSFSRPGARVEARKRARSIIAPHHKRVGRDEIISFLQKNFNVSVE